eukprot:jgi/Chlat1/584/Chrsp103S00003
MANTTPATPAEGTPPAATNGEARAATGGEGAQQQRRGRLGTGARIWVYWPQFQSWYAGTLTYFTRKTQTYRITYDDGEQKDINLDDEIWAPHPRPGEPMPWDKPARKNPLAQGMQPLPTTAVAIASPQQQPPSASTPPLPEVRVDVQPRPRRSAEAKHRELSESASHTSVERTGAVSSSKAESGTRVDKHASQEQIPAAALPLADAGGGESSSGKANADAERRGNESQSIATVKAEDDASTPVDTEPEAGRPRRPISSRFVSALNAVRGGIGRHARHAHAPASKAPRRQKQPPSRQRIADDIQASPKAAAAVPAHNFATRSRKRHISELHSDEKPAADDAAAKHSSGDGKKRVRKLSARELETEEQREARLALKRQKERERMRLWRLQRNLKLQRNRLKSQTRRSLQPPHSDKTHDADADEDEDAEASPSKNTQNMPEEDDEERHEIALTLADLAKPCNSPPANDEQENPPPFRGQFPRSVDMDLRSWLNLLGLAKYAAVLELHQVDFEHLPVLTMQRLKDMGVLAVGPRRKMVAAISAMTSAFDSGCQLAA